MNNNLPKETIKTKMPLPEFSPTLGRWLFIRPQPKITRKPRKIGRWILAFFAGWLVWKGCQWINW